MAQIGLELFSVICDFVGRGDLRHLSHFFSYRVCGVKLESQLHTAHEGSVNPYSPSAILLP